MDFNNCDNCLYDECCEDDFPCNNCIHCIGNHGKEHFHPINSGEPKEEINHPLRYAGGKYECIDVMVDVFGVEVTKHFCLLNAFKYIWRQEHKNGVEDIKKAEWYLNKYIELSENTNENV